MAGPEVGQLNRHAPVLDAVAKYVEDAALVDLGRDSFVELALCHGDVAVRRDQLLERLVLRRSDEDVELSGVEPKVGGVVARPALEPAVREQLAFDRGLERLFLVDTRTHDTSAP
ncbi:MAG TPA: hypothetical protein VIR54_18125, partial [Vicinamibacterales bacterium]